MKKKNSCSIRSRCIRLLAPFVSFALAFLLLAIQSCEKKEDQAPTPSVNSTDVSIQEARVWFDGYLKTYQPINNDFIREDPNWERAKESQMSNGQDLIIVPIEHHSSSKPANPDTYLWVFRNDDNKLTYKVIEFLSSVQSSKNYLDVLHLTGAMIVRNWEGNLLNGFTFQNGKPVGVLEKLDGQETQITKDLRSGKANMTICEEVEISRQSCTDYYYKVCVPHLGTCTEWNPNGTFCTTYSWKAPYCYWAPDFPGQTNPSTGGPPAPRDIVVAAGNTAEAIHQNAEWNCFNRQQAATLSIYVEQPNPGTRDPYSGNIVSGIDVGHSFLSINQGGVTRIVGFYPTAGGVTPLQPSQAGGLIRDSGHHYDVKIDIYLTGAELNSVLNKIGTTPSTYNLNTYNCTNFVIDAARAAGVNLPATVGKWPGGAGLNPGDLGEDLRGWTGRGNVTKSGSNAPQRSPDCM
ncbi:hypothetical protein [Dyadobacter fermentans]|uniref:hypothetical protein n=1 Tax=Dyadobacter fermentans TaxID=94254 RepID=UPI001CBFB3F0|nr:hypothetical protein [Dyadobacter fermentans]MBZ1356997.1 hypothetical protein [Dyadobacter fermentans]